MNPWKMEGPGCSCWVVPHSTPMAGWLGALAQKGGQFPDIHLLCSSSGGHPGSWTKGLQPTRDMAFKQAMQGSFKATSPRPRDLT